MQVNKNPSLYTDVGQIVLANPHLNFYQLRPSLSISNVPRLINATPLGTMAGRWKGVGTQDSYQVGDSVLYVWVQNVIQDQLANQAFILGKCSPNHTFAATSLNTMFNGLNIWNCGLYDVQLTQLQRTPYMFDFNSNGFGDIFAGDWSVHGKQTGILVSDEYMGMRSGMASIKLDAFSRRISEASLLRSVNTIGSEEDVKLYNDKIVLMSRFAGKVKDAYGGFVTDNPFAVTATYAEQDDEKKPAFQVQNTISDSLYAQEENIVADEDKTLASDQRRFDGIRTISSKTGLSLERDFDLNRYRYEGRRIEFEQLEEERTIDDPQAVLEKSEKWKKRKQELTQFLYTPVSAADPENVKTPEAVFTDELGEHYAANGKAHIRLLPTGGISIMDAWGSEILLEGGNVQISAANNLIRLVGRDEVGIVSGVWSTAATTGVELGASNGSASMFGKTAAGVASEGTTTLEGNKLYSYGHTAAVTSGSALQFVSRREESSNNSNGAGIQFFAEESNITASAGQILMSADTSFTARGNTAAVSLFQTSAVVGAARTQLTGGLLIKNGSFDVSVPDANKEKPDTITIGGGTSYIACDGYAIINDTIKGNSGAVIVGALTANSVSAARRNSDGGVFKARSQSSSRLPGSFASSVTNLTKNIANAVSKTYNNIKNSIIRQLRFGFKLSSMGSVCVNEPKFSSMSSGTISITPVSTVDGSDNVTYIYPGESFWMKDGMFSYTERSVIMKSPEDTTEKKRTGAVNIKVSPPTAKRG